MCKGLDYFYRFLPHHFPERQSKVFPHSRQQKLNLESRPTQAQPAPLMVLCDLGKSGNFSGLSLLSGLTLGKASLALVIG